LPEAIFAIVPRKSFKHDITIFDQVAQLGAGSIVSGCYAAPVYPNAFCDLLTRAPASSARANQILTVNDSYVNEYLKQLSVLPM
jgi:hypothetical protein